MWRLYHFLSKVFPKKELKPHYIIESLRPYCTLFGSRLWGGATNKSDVDLLAALGHLKEITKILDDSGIKYTVAKEMYNMVARQIDFKYCGLVYSISLVSIDDHQIHSCAIELATAFFKDHPENVHRKRYRKEVFEAMINIVDKDLDEVPRKILKYVEDKFPELLF